MSTRYGTAKQIEDTRARLKSYKNIKEDPYKYGSIENKGEFNRNMAKIESDLAKITPPEVKGADLDKYVKRQAQLQNFIRNPCPDIRKPGMVSYYDSWHKPTGAVDQEKRYSDSIQRYNIDESGKPFIPKDGYSAFDEAKDNESIINYGDDGIDVRSLEKWRPANSEAASFIDRPSMTFAPGATVPEEKFDEAVGVPEERRCKGLRANGEQCGGRSQLNSQFCRHHQPKPEPPAA